MIVYYYIDQRHAVDCMLRGCGLDCRRLKAVADSDQLRGIALNSGVAFAWVEHHSRPVPDAIMEAARRSGLIEIRLSDKWARARYNRELADARGA